MEIGGHEAESALKQPLAPVLRQELAAAQIGDTGAHAKSSSPSSPSIRPQDSSRRGRPTTRRSNGRMVDAAFAAAASQNVSDDAGPSNKRHLMEAALAAAAGAAEAEEAATRRRLERERRARQREVVAASGAGAARSKLERSLRADAMCFAACIADSIDLGALSTQVTPPGEGITSTSSSAPAPWSPAPPAPPASSALPPTAATSTTTAVSCLSRLFGPCARRSRQGTAALSLQRAKGLGLEGTEFVQGYGTGVNLVLHMKVFGGKDLFLFRFGCIVAWNFESKQVELVQQRLASFLARPLRKEDRDWENVEVVYKRRQNSKDDDDDDEHVQLSGDEGKEGANAVKHDQIILSSSNPLEMLAHSYAMAQSVRLGSFEIVVSRSISSTRSIPETMAATGDIHLDARELAKQIGGLLVLRCDVNLHTDILDTPEIFWDEERFEPHYVACRGYLDIDKRVDILNQRLGVLKDLYELLQNSLRAKHETKLEWIVIILILVEVVLEGLEVLHDAWADQH